MKILLVLIVFLWGTLAGITVTAAIKEFYWATAYGICLLILTGIPIAFMLEVGEI